MALGLRVGTGGGIPWAPGAKQKYEARQNKRKTDYASLQLTARLEDIWSALDKKGIDRDFLLSRSLISPATCCLVNNDKEKTVEKAFRLTNMLSQDLREYFKLV